MEAEGYHEDGHWAQHFPTDIWMEPQRGNMGFTGGTGGGKREGQITTLMYDEKSNKYSRKFAKYARHGGIVDQKLSYDIWDK